MLSAHKDITLSDLLHRTFGFPAFRANQEAVCRAATEGQDVLLVMPTGAGKSLCYQLPAIARGGTALVISPLIALMDDQAAKLTAAGLRVARIHSGLSRDQARDACRAYLDGNLQFLFIAPERMRVPGFPEMLARRKPSLIAIDEAHCISAWGHDFRPDYRTLGEHLPLLRPSPIIALTATATPTVQRDIVAQLQLQDPALFIHGFRRDNLHIEAVEMSKPRRNEFVVNLLKQPGNRPAIVYAPSRKSAEELASLLGGKAAAYHAGLESSVREHVQKHFQSGQLEVVVATIAFGMGIDKADVRTVVHIALPASVEAYYQEIGRAGRDGLPSRTVLLHSFQDRKMHDFFLERDYPPAPNLAKVSALLTDEFQMPEILAQRLKMSRDDFAKAAEKLASQGAAAIDIDGHVRATGQTRWQPGYEQQIAFRRSQIDRMVAFAEATQCRMAALVQHFGDTADGLKPCGHCDFCAPQHATASPFRDPTAKEDRHLRAILAALKGGVSRSTGKLHTELALTSDRKLFDTYLDALSRAGLLALNTDTFTNPEGTSITYKKATLTYEGNQITSTAPLGVLLRDSAEAGVPHSSPSFAKGGSKSVRPSKATLKAEREQTTAAYTSAQQSLETRLREWRKAEAAKSGKPAFIVCGDATLHNLVLAKPQTLPQLLTVSGIGPEKADRYGADLIALCRESGCSPSSTTTPVTNDLPAFNKAATAPVAKSEPGQKRVPKQLRQWQEDAVRESDKLRGTLMSPKKEEVISLTLAQQTLDTRLRDWRKAEADKLGMPQFFILSSTSLRDIVVAQPQSLPELQKIFGIPPDTLAKFGPAILGLCNE